MEDMSGDAKSLVTHCEVLTGRLEGINEEGVQTFPILGLRVQTADGGEHVYAMPPDMLRDVAHSARHAYDDIEWPDELAPPKGLRYKPVFWLLATPLPFGIFIGVMIGIYGSPRHPGVVTGFWAAWDEYWEIVGMTSALFLFVLPWLVPRVEARRRKRAERRAQRDLDGSHEALS